MSKPFREINIGGEQSKMPSEKKHSKGCLEGQVMYLILCIQLLHVTGDLIPASVLGQGNQSNSNQENTLAQ